MNRSFRVPEPKDRVRGIGSLVSDEVRFLKTWASRPLTTGAVTASGKALARAMAAPVDPAWDGVVVELGPGTGAVTAALLERGVAPERLVAIEYNPDFAEHLAERFPGIRVICGDAYDLGATLRKAGVGSVSAVVSSLPLLTRPPMERRALVEAALGILPEGRPLVQFSYAFAPPVAADRGRWSIAATDWIFMNLPPARVWTYSRAPRN
jgi:phosphatidylethanolamine/phosphatidyl-N-methylethanolamine N-methyltransferase